MRRSQSPTVSGSGITARPSSRCSPASRVNSGRSSRQLALGLKHQNQPIHEHRRRISAVAPRTGQIPIRQPANAQSMIELGQQGQAPMGRQYLVRPFQRKGQHALAYHRFILSVNGCVWSHTRYIRAQRGRQGLFMPPTHFLSVLGMVVPESMFGYDGKGARQPQEG